MTVLSACQDACPKLNQAAPTSLFSTTAAFAVELRSVANDTAEAVAKAYDWQKQKKLQTMTGDGVTTAFTLPSDYDRMVLKSNVLTSQFASALTPAKDMDHWLDLQLRPYIAAPGVWIILGGQMQILPALGSGVLAKFYYVGNKYVTGGTKTAFDTDTDTFDLPERLIRLGVIWRWRASKRMDYSEDLKNFEIALAEEISRDKGSRVITVGRQRIGVDAVLAHPAITAP